jgi:DNA ligase (NAD+)
VGEKTLEQLVMRGFVKTPDDLFTLSYPDYAQCERVGEKHYQKLQDGLKARTHMSVAQFFAALDIEGEGTWDNITAVPGLQTYDQIMDAALSNNHSLFAQSVRVTFDKAHSICQQIQALESDIKALHQYVTFKQAGTNLSGVSFCITGSLSRPRPQVEADIKAAGGRVTSSVPKKKQPTQSGQPTFYLVTDNPHSNSGKAKNAHSAGMTVGVDIIDETQLKALLS